MDVIKTPTAVADKFGAGLNGFRSESPGLPATQLSPEFADSVQMEIVNVIISQGIALDDLVFDQMATAIGSYSFANPKVTGSLSIKGGAMLFVENLGTLEMLSGSGLIIGNGSTLAVQANVTLSASDNTWTWGSSNTNDWTINGDVTLGTDNTNTLNVLSKTSFTQEITAITGVSFKLLGTASIDGVAGTVATVGTLGLLSGAPAPSARQLAAGVTGQLVWHDGSAAKFVHYSPNGWVFATGDQEAATATAANTICATTTQTVTGVGLGTVRVIVAGLFQVNSLGSTVTVNLQHDQAGGGVWTTIGTGLVITAQKTTADANDWQPFRCERVFNAGTSIATLYRLSLTAQGGFQARVKEVRLRVTNERA